jgi:hypothetical protein
VASDDLKRDALDSLDRLKKAAAACESRDEYLTKDAEAHAEDCVKFMFISDMAGRTLSVILDLVCEMAGFELDMGELTAMAREKDPDVDMLKQMLIDKQSPN